jgi:hypothetical protein
LFVGIGPTADVDGYLNGVGRAFVPGDTQDARLTEVPGGAPPGPPAAQPFWTARSQGTGAQAVSWTPQPGTWSLVVMNADGSAGVAVTAQLGFKTDLALWVGIGALVVGLILLAIGVVLLVSRSRARARSRSGTGPPPPRPPPSDPTRHASPY